MPPQGAWDLGVFVDIHFDERDGALAGADRLFENRRQLLAGAAPRRPKIDQHRPLARGLDDIGHEVLGRGVLDGLGAGCRVAVAQDRGVHTHFRFRLPRQSHGTLRLSSLVSKDGPMRRIWQPWRSDMSLRHRVAARPIH